MRDYSNLPNFKVHSSFKFSVLIVFLSILELTSTAQNEAYAVCADASLYKIDLSTCSAQLIGFTPLFLNDIAFNPINSTYYAISARSLYTIDVSNGSLSFIGNIGSNFTALTFDNKGVLYAMSNQHDELFTINTTTAFMTNLGSTGTGIFASGDLTFNKNQLYLSGDPNFLVAIDVNTPSNSFLIGRFPRLGSAYGLTSIGCQSEVYAFSGKSILILNSSNLLQSNIQCLDIVPSNIYGSTAPTELFSSNKINLGNDTIICPGEILTLNVNQPNATYLWQDNSTSSIFNITQQGTYWVKITTIGGCTLTDSLIITASHCEVVLNIPNIFTPNNDGVNDIFTPIKNVGIISINTHIYNRWGVQIFDSNSLSIDWSGDNISAGTYFWIIDYTDFKGCQSTKKGLLTLIR